MKKWTYEPDALDENGNRYNALTNEILLKWLDKYLDPKENYIEISGGEPGMYPEIKTLIPALTEKGYKGLIKTNGSRSIPESKNFKRIAAWHKDKPFPEYYDLILILKNPNDNWQEKEEYCKDRNIAHVCFDYQYYNKPNQPRTVYPNRELIKSVTTMYASGNMAGCSNQFQPDKSIFKDSEPSFFDSSSCTYCGNIGGFESFLLDHFQELLP